MWPENWATVQAFHWCRTQWQIAVGMSGFTYLGLDYPGVESVLRRRKVKERDAVFAGIQVMEWAALEVLNTREE